MKRILFVFALAGVVAATLVPGLDGIVGPPPVTRSLTEPAMSRR